VAIAGEYGFELLGLTSQLLKEDTEWRVLRGMPHHRRHGNQRNKAVTISKYNMMTKGG